MTPKNQKMRDALKQIEGTITSALAHQPEEDETCGQFLYDTLVGVFNAADMACHEYRDDESDDGDELKRCPFCGAQAQVIRFGNEDIVECKFCGTSTPSGGSREGSIRIWNTRFPS